MKSVALFVSCLAAVNAFAPNPAGRPATQINESLFDKVCYSVPGRQTKPFDTTAVSDWALGWWRPLECSLVVAILRFFVCHPSEVMFYLN